jgi:hypothetical protein
MNATAQAWHGLVDAVAWSGASGELATFFEARLTPSRHTSIGSTAA